MRSSCRCQLTNLQQIMKHEDSSIPICTSTRSPEQYLDSDDPSGSREI